MSDYEEYQVKVYNNGDKFWYRNGRYHRLDGPACEYVDGTKYWYQNDRRHRLDGPACEYVYGDKRWYIEGKELTEPEFLKRTQPKIPDPCEGKIVEIDGKKYKLSLLPEGKV